MTEAHLFLDSIMEASEELHVAYNPAIYSIQWKKKEEKRSEEKRQKRIQAGQA